MSQIAAVELSESEVIEGICPTSCIEKIPGIEEHPDRDELYEKLEGIKTLDDPKPKKKTAAGKKK